MNTATHAAIYNAAKQSANVLLQLLNDFYKEDGVGQLDALLIIALMDFLGIEDTTCTLTELFGNEIQWEEMNEHQRHNSKVLEVFQDRFLKHAN